MKEHARTATKLIGEEIARLTQLARAIKAGEATKPCDDNKGGAYVSRFPLTYGTQEYQEEFWRAVSQTWHARYKALRKERHELWMQWYNRYVELKRFKLANFGRAEIEAELARRDARREVDA